MIDIIPTNTCPADFAEFSRRSAAFADFAEWVQLDISDGLFTPVKSWPYHEKQWPELEAMADNPSSLPSGAQLKYETHLMVEEPRDIGSYLAQAGVRRIIGHVESFGDEKGIRAAFDAWRAAGATEVGLSLLLHTPLPTILPVLAACDVVQIMSIATLGSQGAPYDARAVERIRELRAHDARVAISVDGGVSERNIADLARAGATRFGVGSAISKAPDPKAAYATLKRIAENALQ